jgi:hypothetical protein
MPDSLLAACLVGKGRGDSPRGSLHSPSARRVDAGGMSRSPAFPDPARRESGAEDGERPNPSPRRPVTERENLFPLAPSNFIEGECAARSVQ